MDQQPLSVPRSTIRRMSRNPYLETGAQLSDDGVFRYALWRRLSQGDRSVTFVGLNPSTADATDDDQTIRRCVGFARLWRFDWLYMANLYAFRSTQAKGLEAARDPIGPLNPHVVRDLVDRSDLVIAGWGAHDLNGEATELAAWVMSLPKTHCLGLTKAGAPRHPLYVKSTTPFTRPF